MPKPQIEIVLQRRVDTGLRTSTNNGIVYVSFCWWNRGWSGGDSTSRVDAAQTLRRWRNKFKIVGYGYGNQEYGIQVNKFS